MIGSNPRAWPSAAMISRACTRQAASSAGSGSGASWRAASSPNSRASSAWRSSRKARMLLVSGRNIIAEGRSSYHLALDQTNLGSRFVLKAS